MQTDLSARQSMMEILENAFEAVSPSNPGYKRVIFKNAGDAVLCYVPFESFVAISAGDDAVYEFRSVSNEPVLQAGIESPPPVDTNVSKFAILGLHNGFTIEIIKGSVGGTNLQDIRFNTTSWPEGTFITLSRMRISLKQGT